MFPLEVLDQRWSDQWVFFTPIYTIYNYVGEITHLLTIYLLGGGFKYFLFSPLFGEDFRGFPIWLIFFRWVETTNQLTNFLRHPKHHPRFFEVWHPSGPWETEDWLLLRHLVKVKTVWKSGKPEVPHRNAGDLVREVFFSKKSLQDLGLGLGVVITWYIFVICPEKIMFFLCLVGF